MARYFFPVVRFLGHHVLTMRTPIGRKARPQFISRAAPLIRVKAKDLEAAGVSLLGRTNGVRDGLPVIGEETLDVRNVIWCTGYRYDFDWLRLPVIGTDGSPEHRRGIAEGQPGLYFVGLKFQFAASSDVLPGVGRDAEYIAKAIARRTRQDVSCPRVRRCGSGSRGMNTLVTVDGGQVRLTAVEVEDLDRQLDGRILVAGDEGWTEAVVLQVAVTAGAPSLVVQPTSVRDIETVVRFANTHRLLLCVKARGEVSTDRHSHRVPC
jgi:hypothetical protein